MTAVGEPVTRLCCGARHTPALRPSCVLSVHLTEQKRSRVWRVNFSKNLEHSCGLGEPADPAVSPPCPGAQCLGVWTGVPVLVAQTDGWSHGPSAPLRGGRAGEGFAQPNVAEEGWGWQDGGPGGARGAPGDCESSRGLCVQLWEPLDGQSRMQGPSGEAVWVPAGGRGCHEHGGRSTLFLKVTAHRGEGKGVADVGMAHPPRQWAPGQLAIPSRAQVGLGSGWE